LSPNIGCRRRYLADVHSTFSCRSTSDHLPWIGLSGPAYPPLVLSSTALPRGPDVFFLFVNLCHLAGHVFLHFIFSFGFLVCSEYSSFSTILVAPDGFMDLLPRHLVRSRIPPSFSLRCLSCLRTSKRILRRFFFFFLCPTPFSSKRSTPTPLFRVQP